MKKRYDRKFSVEPSNLWGQHSTVKNWDKCYTIINAPHQYSVIGHVNEFSVCTSYPTLELLLSLWNIKERRVLIEKIGLL